MDMRVILFLTLFTGLCVADSKGNLALNGVAVQSSLGHPQGDAQHAVDGNRDSDYKKESCTITKTEFNPWWRVDLGNVYSVSNVTITNRGDCCKDRLRGAQIRIGNKLDNNGNNNELAATILTAPNGTETFSFESVNGRYVNIFLPGNDEILTLCEVEVFAVIDTPSYICGPRNLALGATAVQSSILSGAGAQRAVDGNRNSLFSLGSCSHTNADRDPWWRVDLGEKYKVTRVSITNIGDGSAARINGAQIRIGNSLENNGNNNELAATVVSIPLGETKTFQFQPIKGRYVNIVIPGRNEYLHMCEVEMSTAVPQKGPGPGVDLPVPQQQQLREISPVYLCRIGQETVQDIVTRTMEIFQITRATQLPHGVTQIQAAYQDRFGKLQEHLRQLTLLFRKLRLLYERCVEMTPDLQESPAELVPFVSEETEAVRMETCSPAVIQERREVHHYIL
ncbi:unnamed protein product [Leuciscus chuanchicus]